MSSQIPKKLSVLFIKDGVVLPGATVRLKITSPRGYVSKNFKDVYIVKLDLYLNIYLLVVFNFHFIELILSKQNCLIDQILLMS